MMTGMGILALVVALTVAFGITWRAKQGRVRMGSAKKVSVELPARIRAAIDPSAAVTLVQLSSTFCAPCRQAKVLLADLANRTQGLHHVELDVTSTPEVAAQLKVLRTPTTLALTADGAELLRIGGVPRREALAEALRPYLS